MSSKRREGALNALNREVRGWQADQELFDSVVVELAGLNRTDWRCLDILGTRGPMTAGQLAKAVRLTTGAVTGVLDRLGAPVYGPLIADASTAHAVFDADQLELITRFIRIERELLAKHTERLAAMNPAASRRDRDGQIRGAIRAAARAAPSDSTAR